ncbi:conserved hypothetical protein [Vibrio chagasii]|nr:conserved hypothetical protein [Vibrio chagasii]
MELLDRLYDDFSSAPHKVEGIHLNLSELICQAINVAARLCTSNELLNVIQSEVLGKPCSTKEYTDFESMVGSIARKGDEVATKSVFVSFISMAIYSISLNQDRLMCDRIDCLLNILKCALTSSNLDHQSLSDEYDSTYFARINVERLEFVSNYTST